jgi:penicillin-binding protein 1B
MPRKASRSKKTAVSRPRRKKTTVSPSRRKKASASPVRRKKATASSPRRKKYLFAAALLLAAFAVYLGYLNYLINSRFEGGAWALPSRVYARALELYPNLAITRDQLVYELDLSSYLQVQHEPLPGQYRLLGESLELHSRQFDFGDQLQDARLVQVFFERGRISALTDSSSLSDLQLFRLPPVILGSYYPDNGEDRLLLAENEVPQRLIDTLIAVEDRGFFEHSGLSPMAILRALLANLQAGRAVQGGSTLTQQLAKNLFLTPEKSLLRKINEAFMAILLELRFSKQTIITAYVNEVFLLQQNRIAIHGFARASRMLFRRSVDNLEVQHVALLVGMVNGWHGQGPFALQSV